MSIDSHTAASEAAILSRIILPDAPSLTADAARALLALDFHPQDQERMQLLAEKASAGTLTLEEQVDAKNYNHIGHLLALLQSKARLSLKRAGSPS